MMTSNSPSSPPASLLSGLFRNRRAMMWAGGSAVVLAAVFSWGWLVAIGVAPLILAFLPCAAMCALGLCMNKTAGTTGTSAPDVASPFPQDVDADDRAAHVPLAVQPRIAIQRKTLDA